MGKKIFFLIFVALAYLFYARYVLSPQIFKNFSLIDDGQSIKYGIYVRECLVERKCTSFKSQIIEVLPDVGLSRTGYWLIQGILYQPPRVDAQFQHELRIYGFGLALVILFVLSALSARSHAIAVTLGAALFVTNYSFSENMIRLGPIEPYMVLFLGIFSLLFLNLEHISKKLRGPAIIILSLTLIFLLLLKEASIAILPAVFILGILFPKVLHKKALISMLIVSGAIFILVKMFLGGAQTGPNYSSNYRLNLLFILQNGLNFLKLLSNSLSPFFEIFLIAAPFTLIIKKFRQGIAGSHFVYWLLVFVSFTVILFPWRYVLDRYLLPSIYAFSILVTILISRVMNEIEKMSVFSGWKKVAFQFLAIFTLCNLFFVEAPLNIARTLNYRNWFATFIQFEKDQVDAIAKVKEGTVYLNAKETIDNWEVVYEIPMHLNYFHGGKPEVERLKLPPPSEGDLFTRSSLESVINLESLSNSNYTLLDSKAYHVSRIDPNAFRNNFGSRPIQTLKNPPFLNEGFRYYWEIRSLEI